ncbi:hypothetical protein CROQUDRAFT_96684 [Cronartium quercuum f. sp. fusiforme G11]|uniref:Uncharacterized protein n=1 Tax=Cronartium quercuum f. sp. fusiforme G11 TaxID=708437 RepID=A0A9P6T9Z8_9BASI|nr:hypothetical protein CROQUDRAFT_96684 [Cronartium quercuum f. sp. fusiforme G11]
MSGNGSNGGKPGFGMDKGKGKEKGLSMDKGVQGVLAVPHPVCKEAAAAGG